MNNLSILIYLADVAGSLSALLRFVGISAFLGFVGTILISGFDACAGPFSRPAVYRWSWAAVGTVSLLLAGLIPEAETVYAIAASEMGEEIIASETGGKALEAVNSWLDSQLSSPVEEPSDEV